VRPFRSNEQHLIDPKGIWLIKKSKIENGGTQIEGKDDKLVIQHVLSGRYLASSDDGYASLSSELWEKNVCWSLQSYSGSEDGAGSIAHGDVAWIIQDSKTGKDDSAAGEVIWLSDISAEPDHACVQVNFAARKNDAISQGAHLAAPSRRERPACASKRKCPYLF
jgi:hypothetical protein